MGEAYEVPVEKPKKRRRGIDEESFEAGRILGVIARKDPELYERLRNYANATGKKMTDVIHEALVVYDDYIALGSVDTRCLMAALRLLDNLFKRLLQMMMTLNQYFTTEFFQQQIDIIYQLQQQRAQQQQQAAIEEKRARQSEVKAKLMEMTMNLFMNMLSALMATMTGGKAPMPMQGTAATGGGSALAIKPKIVASAKKGGKHGGKGEKQSS